MPNCTRCESEITTEDTTVIQYRIHENMLTDFGVLCGDCSSDVMDVIDATQ